MGRDDQHLDPVAEVSCLNRALQLTRDCGTSISIFCDRDGSNPPSEPARLPSRSLIRLRQERKSIRFS
jgi:hypothetical protein